MTKKRHPDIILYDTPEDCVEAFCGEIPKTGYWDWFDEDGKLHHDSWKRSLKDIRELGCWGWVENKKIVHVWISKRASKRMVLWMLTHEMSHIRRPHYLDQREEEMKAGQAGRSAREAYDAMTHIARFKGMEHLR